MTTLVAAKKMIERSIAGAISTDQRRMAAERNNAVGHYHKLAAELYQYAQHFEDDPYLGDSIEHIVTLVKLALPGQVKRVINSFCRLLETRTEPVLITASLQCFARSVVRIRRSSFRGSTVTRIKNTLMKATAELELDAIIDAPVEMHIELLQSRFNDDFIELRVE